MLHRKEKHAKVESTRIRSLRRKFMRISMISFVLVMMFATLLVNIAIDRATRSMMDEILDTLIANEGVLAEDEGEIGSKNSPYVDQLNYGMRYFTVILDEEEVVESMNLENVKLIDEDTALNYTKAALDSLFSSGFIDDYYFKIGTLDNDRIIVAFVNGSIQSSILQHVLLYSILICAGGLFLTGAVAWQFSKSAIQSEMESYQRQKSFITNASHELKTPLAVIRANTEIIEMMSGENEWTESTLRQVEHMNGLIQNLVMISRAAEKEERTPGEKVNFTEVVQSMVEPFKSVAIQDKKELHLDLEEGAVIEASESNIRQLVSILTDNALKYCDPEGRIDVKLAKGKRGKTVILTVSNDYKEGANVDCSRFFDRFYREDSSHENQQGYGIGLSMAESICKQYDGKISAEWKDGVISFICVLKA